MLSSCSSCSKNWFGYNIVSCQESATHPMLTHRKEKSEVLKKTQENSEVLGSWAEMKSWLLRIKIWLLSERESNLYPLSKIVPAFVRASEEWNKHQLGLPNEMQLCCTTEQQPQKREWPEWGLEEAGSAVIKNCHETWFESWLICCRLLLIICYVLHAVKGKK